jgi:hypothetical protein
MGSTTEPEVPTDGSDGTEVLTRTNTEAEVPTGCSVNVTVDVAALRGSILQDVLNDQATSLEDYMAAHG